MGLLNWVIALWRAARVFTFHLRRACSALHRTRVILTPRAMFSEARDLAGIIRSLPIDRLSTSFGPRDRAEPMIQDASDWGAGGFVIIGDSCSWWQIVWSPGEKALFPKLAHVKDIAHIGVREFFAAFVSVCVRLSLPGNLSDKILPIFSDNRSTVDTFTALRSAKDPVVDHLLKHLVRVLMSHGLDIGDVTADHTPGIRMEADPISRSHQGAAEFVSSMHANPAVSRVQRVQVQAWIRRALIEASFSS